MIHPGKKKRERDLRVKQKTERQKKEKCKLKGSKTLFSTQTSFPFFTVCL